MVSASGDALSLPSYITASVGFVFYIHRIIAFVDYAFLL